MRIPSIGTTSAIRAKYTPSACPCSKFPQGWEALENFAGQPYRHDMVTILCVQVSIFAFRFRSRASLELRLLALQHQLAVLRRQRPGRPPLSSLDRLLWVWLYRLWPQIIDAMVLVKPATLVQWHRKGVRFYWRWRSRRPGRPKIGTEIRDLIRRMCKANPLWGGPRIHGELLKLDTKISQATVGRWVPWRPKVPSSTWRSFLRNHLPDLAAIDMFVVATATFQLLYGSYSDPARPASCKTLPQRTTSVLTNVCNSSSDPLPIGFTPRLTSCCLTSAVFTIAFTSALSLARIGLGVFAGALSIVQAAAS
jgi:hypothetical protein